jgi:hypothetical protein
MEEGMRLRILIICLVLLTATGVVRAEKYAGEFMALGGGARAMAMGGAFTAIANDATATFWNPAGLGPASFLVSDPKQVEMVLMHSERFGDLIDYNYISAAFPLKSGKSGWGLTFIHMGIPDIRIVPLEEGMIGNSNGDIEFDTDTEFLNFDPNDYPFESANDYALFLSYAQVFGFGSLGASVKLIMNDQVTNVTSYGIGIDIGFLKTDLWRRLMIGAKLQDATGTYISWSTGKREFIYPSLKTGLAYPIEIDKVNSVLLLAVDGEFRFENRRGASQFWIGSASADFNFGMELVIRDIVSLRGGLNMGRPTAGAGFLFKNFSSWDISLGLDYALLVHDVFDTTHRISLLIAH